MADRARRQTAAWLVIGLLVAACSPSASPSRSQSASASPSATVVPTPGVGDVVPAPGSSSEVYRPNPGAIVVAIDPGHGGCLDWGVPDPLKRGPAYAEKTMTLAIALKLRSLLEAQGITVVLTRQTDEALAGDYYPDLGCTGPPFRDVNGDGASGFDPGGKTRTRDELQSRIDLVNVARADILVSIHINSLTTPDGTPLPIAATQSYFTDETTWGLEAGQRLANDVQDGVVAALQPVAGYERQDRGVQAITYFIIAPPLYVATAERPDPHTQPTRGILMPGTLSEVGSITLAAEQDLLASESGQAAVAQGIESGLAAYFTDRPMAVRYDALLPGGSAATVPPPVEGLGPPYWIPTITPAVLGDGLLARLTNTGTQAWPSGLSLLGGWGETDQPYLRQPPESLAPIGVDVPSLAPGESVQLRLPLSPTSGSAREVLWVTLAGNDQPWTAIGAPPLQLAFEGS
jgi:N-acetylmuramoyl-L-alanine amidase